MKETIREIIDISSKEYAQLDAIRYLKNGEVVSKTYSELGADVRRLAGAISGMGLSRGHVAITGKSSYFWGSAYLGAVCGGFVGMPIDALLSDEEALTLLQRGEAECLFADPEKAGLIALVREKAPEVRVILLTDEETEGESWKSLAAPEDYDYEAVEVYKEDLATIMFTSGTTGVSKGVMLSQENLAADVVGMYFPIPAGTRLLSVLPIHHAFCLTVDWLKVLELGAVCCINDSLGHMLNNMKTFSPEYILMVPLMIETISKRLKKIRIPLPKKMIAKEAFGGSLKVIIVGGARLDPYYVEEFEKYGIELWQGCGMTETSPVISFNGFRGKRTGSCGRPLENIEVRIRDEEIQVKGPIVMQGYYKMPEETAEALDAEGWLHTGDLGRLDEDGFLYITGRRKNLIILANGENVSPEDLEGKLSLLPVIGEVVVMGSDKGLTAHIYPDPDVTRKWNEEKIRKEVDAAVQAFNRKEPPYRRIQITKLRSEPFEKSTTRKIKRGSIEADS
ncbi:MAG: AMP-binding protein [Lachnospiraceae bacterium]|nr:AMP-binding protein [Lachnospiraceae bacterium]